MMRHRDEISLGFTRELFPEGTHMCLLFDDDERRRKLISQYVEAGLSRGEYVGYFSDEEVLDDAESWLTRMGIDVPPHADLANLAVFSAPEVYCGSGKFVPEEMLETIRRTYLDAVTSGHPGARISGEMSWACRSVPGSERLCEYESLINRVVETHPVTAVCQYDTNLFDGATIAEILKVHPMLIVGEQIVRNPYYIKTEEYIAQQTVATADGG